jgi:hypothetical protein
MSRHKKKSLGRQSKGFQNSQKAARTASSKSNKVTNQQNELSAQDSNIMSKSKKVNVGSDLDPILSNSTTVDSKLNSLIAYLVKEIESIKPGTCTDFNYKVLPEAIVNHLVLIATWEGFGIRFEGDTIYISNTRGMV